MPITNGATSSSGTFNVGRDLTMILQGPFGQVQLNNVMMFESKQITASIKVDCLNGNQLNAALPKGWEGSFELERGDPNVDNLFAQIEAAWYNGGNYNVSTAYTYINEAGGNTTTWQYDNMALTLSDAGSWKGDASVRQKVSFVANRRVSV